MITKSKFFKKVVESLQKGSKDYYKKQLPGDEHNDAVDFAASIPNSNHSQWYVNAYKKDPSIHTPENKQIVHEFATHPHPTIKALRFDKGDDFHSGLDKIKNVKNEAIKDFNKKNRISNNQERYSIIHQAGDHAIVSAGGSCDLDEGKAMDHCGNEPAENDESQQLLSLRQKRC